MKIMQLDRILVLGGFLFFSGVLCADDLKENTKLWSSAQIKGSISQDKKWNYYLEPQLRFIDDKYKFNQLNLYAAIYYQSKPGLNWWGGLFRQYQQSSNGKSSQEYRLWEQVGWDVIENSSLTFTSRSRFEQRKNFIYSQIANRFREKLTLKIPMKAFDGYYLVIADEGFFQLNQPVWVVNRVFAENRAAIGVQIPLTKKISYEIGYLNQFQYGKPNQMSNVLYINLAVSNG